MDCNLGAPVPRSVNKYIINSNINDNLDNNFNDITNILYNPPKKQFNNNNYELLKGTHNNNITENKYKIKHFKVTGGIIISIIFIIVINNNLNIL